MIQELAPWEKSPFRKASSIYLSEGDRVAFIHDEGSFITKASLLAIRELQDALSKDAKEQGISEQDVLDELIQLQEELWNERLFEQLQNLQDPKDQEALDKLLPWSPEFPLTCRVFTYKVGTI